MQRVLKNIIKKLLFRLLPKDRVLFESYPDFSDNTRCVYDELVRKGYNKKYKFVWVLQDEDPERCPEEDNVSCIPLNDERAYSYHVRRAKAVISCNRMLGSYVPEQFSFYVEHGAPFKLSSVYQQAPSAHLGYYLSSSAQSAGMRKEFLKIRDDTQIISFGFPRNDVFYKPELDLKDLFKSSCEKFIAWYPTFRNHKYEQRNEGCDPLPVIHDTENAIKLNEVAKQLNTLIVLKPHPVQDLKLIQGLRLSNITFITDSFFDERQIKNYDFLHSCDALLSDYSSVFLDFLLADKPIGLVWEDIDQYTKDLGLVENYKYLASGCEKIYTIEDLIDFVISVAKGEDHLISERREVRDYMHTDSRGHSTENVVDLIINKAGL